ncbi:transcriptional regulator, TetR family [Saccharopolyspora kobensis]|uniref:Transcriptional regulator, TetR family n=1 Tax=Saccharopolyspora kobensis TaxID=146035 RepID=A0A1H5WP21_9PSEU|nr:TetR/AcrR family transcriptional regulator [Saccharopolyspora kobensis]SEG01184.1 transcriptional regulator, TetR family [Saccharopolyspora kobensis]SFD77949.1 transcriptional regulator, TetR family [Saccharopolyspora kobensis]
MTEGLRERKKRRTRQHISGVATALFVQRGFDQVTIAEVAAAAEVSVNTVYNYFPTKEDLVLPPEEASPQRLADIVRARRSGQSAAGAVLEQLRAEVARRDRKLGMSPGFAPVLAMMRAAPTLLARLEALGGQMTEALAEVLAEETGADAADPLPRVVAHQLGGLHSLVYAELGAHLAAGARPEELAEAATRLLDAIERALSDNVLDYATREDRTCSE